MMPLQTRRETDNENKRLQLTIRIIFTLLPIVATGAISGFSVYLALHDDIKDLKSNISVLYATEQQREIFTQIYRDGLDKHFDQIDRRLDKNEDVIQNLNKRR